MSGAPNGTDEGQCDQMAAAEPPIDEAQVALDHIDLINVVPRSIHAEAHDNPNACSDVRYQVEAQYTIGPGFFGNRFRYQIELIDQEEEPTATLDFELQVEYDVSEDYEASHDVAAFLTQTTGIFAAYPYARELAQTLTARLQQDPLVLGLMPRGATGPSRVSGGRAHRSATEVVE